MDETIRDPGFTGMRAWLNSMSTGLILTNGGVTIGLHPHGVCNVEFVRNRRGRGGYTKVLEFDSVEHRARELKKMIDGLIDQGYREM